MKAVFSERCLIRRPACQSRWVEPSPPRRGNPASVSAQVGPAQSAGLKVGRYDTVHPLQQPRDPQKELSLSQREPVVSPPCCLLSGKSKALCSLGAVLQLASSEAPFPAVTFRRLSFLRKPARPLQVHRAGGIPQLHWSGSYQTAILINQLWSP